jgi:hypothetical protein
LSSHGFSKVTITRLLVATILAATFAACSAPAGVPTAFPAGSARTPKQHAERPNGEKVCTKSINCQGGPPTGPNYVMTYHGGTLLTSVQSEVVYFGYDPSWGDQTTFLKNLYASAYFAHLMNQYVPNRGSYTVAPPVYKTIPTGEYLDAHFNEHEYYDVAQILEDTVLIAGKNVGPHYLYHIITPGDLPYCEGSGGYTCVNDSTGCGNTGSCVQTECGEHDYGSALNGNNFYTIQGDPNGACDTPVAVPSGAVTTLGREQTLNSSIEHEVLESITDPYYDNGSPAKPAGDIGWIDSAGYEISDICGFYAAAMNLNGAGYWAELAWSNSDQRCYYIPYTPDPIPFARRHAATRKQRGPR